VNIDIVDRMEDIYLFCETLDDRLGAFILLHILPALNIKCDILLTTDEERCNSTAQYFTPQKEYKWMFSFDRAGSDVVMYQYQEPKYKDILKKYDMDLAYGSYSCIADLEKLGVAGFNFGTGYYGQHTSTCNATLSETSEMILRFRNFYRAFKDTKFPSNPISHVYR